MNKARYMPILGLFVSLSGMETNKENKKSCEPVVFITEVSNKSGQDYVLRHKNRAFSLIKSGQSLLVNKKMDLEHLQGYSKLLWWQLNDVMVTKRENINPLLSLIFSVIVTEKERFFTSSTYLHKHQEDFFMPNQCGELTQVLDNSVINRCSFDSEQERYHVNIQLTLAGKRLQDSTIDVVHILQPKSFN